MYGSFNSEIYFLTDDKKIVEPIANYFSEKIFSESDGIFAWILKNNSHDAFFTAKEKFLRREKKRPPKVFARVVRYRPAVVPSTSKLCRP